MRYEDEQQASGVATVVALALFGMMVFVWVVIIAERGVDFLK